MNYAIGATRNIAYGLREQEGGQGTLVPEVHVSIIVQAAKYRHVQGPAGAMELSKYFEPSTLTFVSHPGDLRGLSAQFTEWADYVEKLERKAKGLQEEVDKAEENQEGMENLKEVALHQDCAKAQAKKERKK